MDVETFTDELSFCESDRQVFVEIGDHQFEIEYVTEDSQGVYLHLKTQDRSMR